MATHRSTHKLGLNLLTAETVDSRKIAEKLTGWEHCEDEGKG